MRSALRSASLGLVELVLLLQRHAQVVERFGAGRVELDQVAENGDGLRKVSLLHEGRAEIQPRRNVGRMVPRAAGGP